MLYSYSFSRSSNESSPDCGFVSGTCRSCSGSRLSRLDGGSLFLTPVFGRCGTLVGDSLEALLGRLKPLAELRPDDTIKSFCYRWVAGV